MAAKHELHEKGLRLTPQRELVLAAVRDLEHATPEEVAEKVRQSHPGINLSTVYRNLETLENVGLVQHTHLGHGGLRYHASTEEIHAHLNCESCGLIIEVPIEATSALTQSLLDDYGFHTALEHLAIAGRCETCFNKP
jgi:Fur family transcriptional regulator, ferric uptake regulator